LRKIALRRLILTVEIIFGVCVYGRTQAQNVMERPDDAAFSIVLVDTPAVGATKIGNPQTEG
jgi:hypothetical protein